MFLRNVGGLPTDYTAFYPRRYSIFQVVVTPGILVDRHQSFEEIFSFHLQGAKHVV
jgi:hypothetical protein